MSPFQRWTLAAVCAATAILMLDIAVVNTALPTIAVDLSAGLEGLKWVVDAYTLALATVVLTAGALADRYGRRRSFIVGVSIFTVSSVACAAAGTIDVLNAARAVQGIGAAIMFAVSLALLANAFPTAKERAGAFAAYGATIGASFAFGPLAGGALTTGLGWRWVFLVNIPIGAAVLYIAFKQLRESKDPVVRKVDIPGQLTLTAGLFGLVFALLRGNDEGWTDPTVLYPLIGAGIFLTAFLVIEARSKAPMLPLGMFRSKPFAGAQIAAFAISAGWFAIFIYATIYLQRILGLSAIEAGLVFMPATLINVVVSGATAQMADKVRPGVLISGGLALVAIGMAMMTVAGATSSWTVLLPGMIVGMIGTGLFNPSVSAVALDVPEAQSGLAAGINDTARQAGIAVGVAALGALFPAGAGLGAADPQAYVDGLHTALLAGAGLAAVGAVAAAYLIRSAKPVPVPGAAAPQPA